MGNDKYSFDNLAIYRYTSSLINLEFDMSFNIPIFLEDSPFFERDSLFRPRNERFTREVQQRRQPDVFRTCRRPGFFFEDPYEADYYRQKYQSRGRGEEFTEQPRRNIRKISNLEGDEDEDPRELGGVNADTGGDYGWDVPVQFVEAPATRDRHHHHEQKSQQRTARQKPQSNTQAEDEERLQKPVERQRQARGVTDKPTKGVVVDREERKTENGDKGDMKEEVLVDEIQAKPKMRGKGKTKRNEEKVSESYQNSAEDDGITVIPVQYSSHEEKPRCSSRRFSQCEPPSPADVKLTRIKSIVEKTEDLDNKIKEFDDAVQNKTYLYISESLMRLLLNLDTVDSEGIDVVRKARKAGVQTVQRFVDELENKLAENKETATSE